MALVKKYKAEIYSVVNQVEGIYTIEFKSLNGRFKYLPGQFLHLALDEYDPSLGWPESRCFSMQSSPSAENIKITYSVKGKYTSRMAAELVIGKTVDLKLPYGELFQQDHSKENVVFIAGGTGITPYLSIFTDPNFKEYSKPKLYFGLREKSCHIYESDLLFAQELNPTLWIDIKYQNVEGVLDIESIFNENGANTIYFISGPQKMISIFKEKLNKNGVPECNIRTDDWE